MLSVVMLGECHVLFTIMLAVIMLSVGKLNVVMLGVLAPLLQPITNDAIILFVRWRFWS
jgi:hypothetical protein